MYIFIYTGIPSFFKSLPYLEFLEDTHRIEINHLGYQGQLSGLVYNNPVPILFLFFIAFSGIARAFQTECGPAFFISLKAALSPL